MGQKEERKGALSQIIVAVVIALLVGSTALWWWKVLFPSQDQDSQNAVPSPVPLQGGQIQVRCTASPHSIAAGGQAEIRVLAYTEQSSPISGASVRVEAGGGWFSLSGTTTEVGQTDPYGVFVTQWRAPSPAAGGYNMAVTVTKNGFTEGRDEYYIPIQ